MTSCYILAIGGTLRANSSTEKALRFVLARAEELGASTRLISGADLDIPPYAPENPERTIAAQRLVEEMRNADGIVIGSPGYHGGISGLVKNAIDYTEDMRGDPRPYFEGKPMGCVATGAGWQGAVSTLAAMRNVVHALRGWNTPVGVPINTINNVFGEDGSCTDAKVATALALMGRQLVEFHTFATNTACQSASERIPLRSV